MVTEWIPYHKTDEWLEVFKKVTSSLPSYIKKWQIFSTSDKKLGVKGYNLITVEKGNAEDAIIEINKLIAPFWKIEGFAMDFEIVMTLKDSMKVIGKSL
ncbi:MAG: hypothetical protein KGD61_06605 [Candidatus Lokiarchaeota archaeon]|nr:hypothetical protein [Candidatus Lokiarchaeota archaeon]